MPQTREVRLARRRRVNNRVLDSYWETTSDEMSQHVDFISSPRIMRLRREGGRGVLRCLLVHAARENLAVPKRIFVFTFPTRSDLAILVRAGGKESVEQRRTASLGTFSIA